MKLALLARISVATEYARLCIFYEMAGAKKQLKSQKQINFAIRNFQKNIDPLFLSIYAPGPQVLFYRPQILRGARI